MAVRYFRESTTGRMKLSYLWIWDSTWTRTHTIIKVSLTHTLFPYRKTHLLYRLACVIKQSVLILPTYYKCNHYSKHKCTNQFKQNTRIAVAQFPQLSSWGLYCFFGNAPETKRCLTFTSLYLHISDHTHPIKININKNNKKYRSTSSASLFSPLHPCTKHQLTTE